MRKVSFAALCCAAVAACAAAPAHAAEPANGQIAATFGLDRLVTFNADGSAFRTVWRTPSSTEAVAAPAWSPDGNLIAFEYADAAHGSRIVVYDLPARTQRLVTDGVTQDHDPGWTADGRILFRRVTSGGSTLMQVAADGTGLTALPIANVGASPVTWAPDGWALYGDRGGTLRLATLDGADDDEAGITGIDLPAAFSPDGWWLAYADGAIGLLSFDEDGDDFSVTDPPGSDRDSAPAWAPEGNALIFKRSRATGVREELRTLDLETGVQRVVRTGNLFSPAWQPCVAGVTVRCASEPVPCLAPGDTPGLDPQPLCPTRIALPAPPRLVPSAPILPAPHTTATLDRHTKRVTVRVTCVARCTLSARLVVRLKGGRVLKGRVVNRTARAISVRVKLPAVPRKRRIASIKLVGTLKGNDGVTRPLSLNVKR
ncbi:MAG TPA: hypothetical protein VNS09_02830 [Solirubrobacter sp.]|nr:hypothetical protein [Solirubrobacter sp.]